jgi:hypothetical protein
MQIDYMFADSLEDVKKIAPWATIHLEITEGAFVVFKDANTMIAWQKNELDKIPKPLPFIY